VRRRNALDEKLWPVLIGIVSGALGYFFTTFIMQPILRFRDVKNQILMDFIYYAQVVNADGLNDDLKDLFRQRVLANRKASAQLSAAIGDLPWAYALLLKLQGRRPLQAASHLIGYSNTTDYEASNKLESSIRHQLGLPKVT
jgi:hypothetical protein